MNIHFNKNRSDWRTPIDLFRELDYEFHFTLDPCCTHESAKCEKHYTIEENGLDQDWSNEVVFMNPPYGREILKWMKKAYLESKNGVIVVCLVPSRTDTRWWHNYATKGEIRFIKGRIKFDGQKHNAPFPSAIVVFKNKL